MINLSKGAYGTCVKSTPQGNPSFAIAENCFDGRNNTRFSSDPAFHSLDGFGWVEVSFPRALVSEVQVRFEIFACATVFEIYGAMSTEELDAAVVRTPGKSDSRLMLGRFTNKSCSTALLRLPLASPTVCSHVRLVCRAGRHPGWGMSIVTLEYWGNYYKGPSFKDHRKSVGVGAVPIVLCEDVFALAPDLISAVSVCIGALLLVCFGAVLLFCLVLFCFALVLWCFDSLPTATTTTITSKGKKSGCESFDCVVCMDEQASHLVVECGHLCGCEACLFELYLTTKKCPICCGPMRAQPIKVYFTVT